MTEERLKEIENAMAETDWLPFQIHTVASMLRESVAEVRAAWARENWLATKIASTVKAPEDEAASVFWLKAAREKTKGGNDGT